MFARPVTVKIKAATMSAVLGREEHKTQSLKTKYYRAILLLLEPRVYVRAATRNK